ncbi:energy-coupling factor transporter transmembrane protein EcfT [Candidatus Woesearchaeota archaeon]|nr:energy-coupling factor transporter transmembrane protein EcfT [Candidatus Woesearchaeota archaeon]
MIKRLTIGQYRERYSFIHGLDARIKIFYVVVLGFLSFRLKFGLEMLIFSLFVFGLVYSAKMRLGELSKNLRPFYSVFIFLVVMYLIFSRSQIEKGMIYLWRFLMLIIISLALTFTTTIMDLIAAVEFFSKPLKVFGVKSRNVALMVSAAVRFIPVMFINFERSREAMSSRLADFRRIRHIKVVVLLMLQKMLKSASCLSDAVYARLYDENMEINKMPKLKINDYISMVAVAAFAVIIY